MRRHALSSAASAVLVLALCGVAAADNYTFHRVSRDDALAARVMFKKADLPAQLNLTGGRVKPDETANNETCKGRAPKESDLVVTGDAETRYSNKQAGIYTIGSQVELLATARMARTDLARSRPFLSAACWFEAAKEDHFDPVSLTVTGPVQNCSCDASFGFVVEGKTSNPAIHLVLVTTGLMRGRVEATVVTVVGVSTGDVASGTATGIQLQKLAVKAVASRLAALPA